MWQLGLSAMRELHVVCVALAGWRCRLEEGGCIRGGTNVAASCHEEQLPQSHGSMGYRWPHVLPLMAVDEKVRLEFYGLQTP